MMVEMAIADSYGAGREFVTPPKKPFPKWNDGKTYLQHPQHPQAPGCYTDDTQMAIAILELMLSGKDWDFYELTKVFTDTFSRDPRQGYAPGFYKFLCWCSQQPDPAIAFMTNIVPTSNKSGGAMRAGPCGLLDDPEDVIDRAMLQASITHGTYEGMTAAAAAAMLVWACRRGGHFSNLRDTMPYHFPRVQWETEWKSYHQNMPGNRGFQAVQAAYSAIMTTLLRAIKRKTQATLTGVLKECIKYGGDTDTVATIAVGAASWHPDIKNNFCNALYTGLENGEYGLGYLLVLDQKIQETYPIVPAKGAVVKPRENLIDLVKEPGGDVLDLLSGK